jgi:hypothetical protein
MTFRFVFWDVLPCKIIVDRRFRGTYLWTSVDKYFTRQYMPKDKSERPTLLFCTYEDQILAELPASITEVLFPDFLQRL